MELISINFNLILLKLIISTYKIFFGIILGKIDVQFM